MSMITFHCTDAQRDALKTGIWALIRDHYLSTVFPNSNVSYDHEGEAVYRERLSTLMEAQLCTLSEDDEGIQVEFDSTEDAGYAIAESVYGTAMGYSDQGLTYLFPLFKAIAAQFGDIPFEADTECYDEWAESSNHFSYDGDTLTVDGFDIRAYDRVMEHLSPMADPEAIAQRTGLSVEEVEAIIETFC